MCRMFTSLYQSATIMNFRGSRSCLLQCDSRQSVLSRGYGLPRVYGCFGWSVIGVELQMGFNGWLQEPAGGYLLGNGNRAYSPLLQRFFGPDSLSPFGMGGLNAYVYCGADPLNRIDPSGNFSLPILKSSRRLSRKVKALDAPRNVAQRFKDSRPLSFAGGTSLGPSNSPELGALQRAATDYRTIVNTLQSDTVWRELRSALRLVDDELEKIKVLVPSGRSLLDIRRTVNLKNDLSKGFGNRFPGLDYRSGNSMGTGRHQFIDNDEFAGLAEKTAQIRLSKSGLTQVAHSPR